MEEIINTVSIKNDYEFKRIYKKGRSFVNASLVVYILKNNLPYNRVGITTSRKIGNAISRNRARRVIREAYRQIENELSLGYDFIFVARTRTCTIKMQHLASIMRDIMCSADVIKK